MKNNSDLTLRQGTCNISPIQSHPKKIFGLVQFYSWASQRQINSVLQNKFTGGLIDKSTWTIQHGSYNSINCAFLFGIILKSQIQRLGLSQNKRPNIIRQIKQVNFPILTKLLLNGNHITSLQFLDHLDAPLLESIALMNNCLTHIRSIKKCNFPFLSFFGIQKNFINEFSNMAKTITKNLCQLLIQMAKNQSVQGHSTSWMMKIQAQNLEELWIQSSKRVKQTKISFQLANKFQEICIEDFAKFNKTP